jgi:hypothetical protein
MPAYQYGRLPWRSLPLGDLTHYLTEPLPAAPVVVAPPQLHYPMAANDHLGDCTIAAVVHTDQATAALVNEPWSYPGDSAVTTEYFQLSNGQDTGLSETTVLQVWNSTGMFGCELAAFAPLAVKHTQTIRQAVFLCGAVYTGVLVPATAQPQFREHRPWDLTGTPADSEIEGSHAVPIVGYNQTGPVVVTWGALQQATWAWWLAFAEEAYAVITHEVRERGVLRGVDFDALDRDLAALETA